MSLLICRNLQRPKLNHAQVFPVRTLKKIFTPTPRSKMSKHTDKNYSNSMKNRNQCRKFVYISNNC